jgi:RNA 2',3'-cyclic 3'-phosphodiesterase
VAVSGAVGPTWPPDRAARRFLALGVPAAVRDELARATAQLRTRDAELRPTPPAGWHVTLAFLGEVRPDGAVLATEVLAATLATVAPRPAPELVVRRAGRFGDRVLVVHLEQRSGQALEAFVERLHAGLHAVGLEVPDRAFRPHLTLARARGARRVTARDVAVLRLPRTPWRPDAVGLWATAPMGGPRPYVVESVLPWPVSG